MAVVDFISKIRLLYFLGCSCVPRSGSKMSFSMFLQIASFRLEDPIFSGTDGLPIKSFGRS